MPQQCASAHIWPPDSSRLPFLIRARIWISYRIARLLIAFYGYDHQ